MTARIVDALPVDGQVDAVGFSMGAATLLELAARMPERFHRLVVAGVGKNLFVDDPERRKAIMDAVEGRDTDDNIGRLFAQYAEPDGQRRRRPGRVHEAHRNAPDARTLRRRHDARAGGHRRQRLRRAGGPLVDALPDARLVTLKGVDHFATPESFAFIDATLEFLDAIPA